MSLCKYKDIFGKLGEGVHSYKIFNIAIVDTVLTFVGAYFLNRYLESNLLLVFFILIVFSILIHRVFCVKSTLTKIFFKF